MSDHTVVYICSKELVKVSSLLPSNKGRSTVVHSLISSIGLMIPTFSDSRRLQVVTPSKASYKDLAVYHSRDYLDAVLDPSSSANQASSATEFGLEDDCPPFPGLPDYVQLIGGATLTAVAALHNDISNIAICWDGGRHHARKSCASGFCYVADCILAILAIKRGTPLNLLVPPPLATVSKKPRIMYLDLDLHYSDAVSDAFYAPISSAPPQILTLSIHHSSPGFFPPSARAQLPNVSSPEFDPLTLSIPLRRGASNTTYARIWPIVEHIKETLLPDYIVVQCGVDALAGDPCATFNWSLGNCEGSLGWCIQRILDWPGKKLLLGGGGYNSPNAARAWAYLTSIALNNPLSLDVDIPDHPGFPLYAPSFTLDVAAGNMFDYNSEEYLEEVETCFKDVILALKNRLEK
ncbi:Arginase/deacetylase [Phlegmacium glaucopus]|nr:Arginase/deacetylase [Phlegmacium glaucopus]